MRRVKVVHIIESTAGGSLNYVRDICEFLEPSTWDVTVIFSRRLETPESMRGVFPEHVKLIELKMQREISFRHDVRSIWKLRNLLVRMNPDVIHLHSSKAGALGRIAALGRQCALVYTPHGFSFYRTDVSGFRRLLFWVIEFCLARISPCRFLVGSERELKSATNLKSPRSVCLVYNAVKVPPKPLEVIVKGETLNVATVGRLTAAKNPQMFLKVAEAILNRFPHAEFMWIGDGEERERFEETAQRHGLPVQVTGWLYKEEVLTRISSVNVYLQTSKWEALPFSLLEAMSLGRPIVATKIPAHEAVIQHGVSGFLGENASELAEYSVRILTNLHLAQRLGAAAWRTVKDFYSFEGFHQKIVDVYSDLVRGNVNEGAQN